MNTVVYLCRHGEVENPNQIWYGRLPGFPLSAHGRQEAARLGAHLAPAPITAIYTSPLTRAFETATIVASRFPQVSITTDDRLMDVLTPTQGRTIAQMLQIDWNFFQPEFVAAGGETLADIWKRMHAALVDFVHAHPGQEIVVVSHGDPIMVVQLKAQHQPVQMPSFRTNYVPTAHGFRILFDQKAGMSGITRLTLPE